MMHFPKLVPLIALFMLIGPLKADDADELRVAFDSALEALNNKDLNTFVAAWHPQAVLFARNRTHPIDRSKMDHGVWRSSFEDFFSRTRGIGYDRESVEFRVIGDTGLAWGLTRLSVDLRTEAGFQQNSRLTAVFAKVGGEWKITHWNDSPLPEVDHAIKQLK